jgi:hypothetical protein
MHSCHNHRLAGGEAANLANNAGYNNKPAAEKNIHEF